MPLEIAVFRNDVPMIHFLLEHGADPSLAEEHDRAMAAGASFIVAPGFDPEVCKHVIDKGGIMMPGTCSAGAVSYTHLAPR